MNTRSGPVLASTFLLLILIPALVSEPTRAENIDPDADGSQYAWGENVGWISAEQDIDHDGNPDQGLVVEDFKVTGWLWGENIGWISMSCLTTQSCMNVRHVVLNDGNGVLSGWAWGENVGWISLSCMTTDSCASVPYGVTIDATTGEFGGHAWGENIGWINFEIEEPAAHPYRIKTGWNCDPPPVPPEGPPELFLRKAGEEVRLNWTAPPGATGYDIVLGDLTLLRAGGDYQLATEQCVRDDHPATVVFEYGPLIPGEGKWFLVRAVNCGGAASYDVWGAQVGSRDFGIEGSGHGCY
jgi:hypothetical protein